MKAWHWAIFWLGCLAAIGCRTDPRIAALEQELRLHEDRIYQLQDCLEDANNDLASCRQENQVPRGGPGTADVEIDVAPEPLSDDGISPPKPSTQREPIKRPAPETRPKSDAKPDLKIDLPDLLQPPATPSRPSPGVPGIGETPESGGTAPKFQPNSDKSGRLPPRVDPPSDADPESARADMIALSDLLTAGFDADGRSGDEGLSVVVQPRDVDGRWMTAAAPISVVVIDPALSGQDARVARWDFSAKQTAQLYRKLGSGEGFHLELPWPSGVPLHRRLRLFVRYTTADGRRLHADKPIEVALAADPAAPGPFPTSPSPTWRRKASGEQAASAGVSPSRLAAPSPPVEQPGQPVARNPRRPLWSPERR